MAADLAVIFRKQDLVNRVACPTKFAEYLGCGLPVLCTEGIGDLSQLVRSNNLGWIMQDPFSDDEMQKIAASVKQAPAEFFANEARLRRSKVASQNFSWDKRIDAVIKRYEKLLGE